MTIFRRPSFFRSSAFRFGLLFPLTFAISALQATSTETLYSNDFSGDVVGEKPAGFQNLRPEGPNVGTTLPFPIEWVQEDGPVGVLIVGDSSEPARSLPGDGNQSLRIYDYTSEGPNARALLEENFVLNSLNNRYDARLDLKFKRSTAIPADPDFPGDLLLISLGEFSENTSFISSANRTIELSLRNDGTWSAHSQGETNPSGTYDGDGVNDLSIIANAHPTDDLDYEGPEGPHLLSPFTYSIYINGSRVAEAIFRSEGALGKFGFMTGWNDSYADIDFLIDDIRITGIRETELVAFTPGLVMDFEDETVGEKPSDATSVRPVGANTGTTNDFPISSGSDGPMGVLVIDGESSPVSSINGRSVRIYDYHTTDKALLTRTFVPEEEEYFPQVRFDFTFRRSVAMLNDDGNQGEGLIVGLGARDSDLRFNSGYALTLRLRSHGTIQVAAGGFSGQTQFEPFDEINDHTVSIFANAQDEEVTFEGPDGQERTLEGYHFTVFLNDEFFNTNTFREDASGNVSIPNLSKLGFTTGQGTANSDIDFVVDDIEISDFSEPSETPEMPALAIVRSTASGFLTLSWESSEGTTYGLEHSPDLQTWTDIGETFSGIGESITHDVAYNSADRGFYRLVSPGALPEPDPEAELTSSNMVRLWTSGDDAGLYEYTSFTGTQIGKAGASDEQRAMNGIQGFQLPTLDRDVSEATYTITKAGDHQSPDWDAQIYIFAPSVTPEDEDPQDLYWASPEEDPSALVRLVELNAFNRTSPNGPHSFTLTSEQLAGFYHADGTPASAGGMIWFRVNPGEETENISDFERLDIVASPDSFDAPTLTMKPLPDSM